MEKQRDKGPEQHPVPDTTHKEGGTTSAFSAASISSGEESARNDTDPKLEGGTAMESDEYKGAKRLDNDGHSTDGIP